MSKQEEKDKTALSASLDRMMRKKKKAEIKSNRISEIMETKGMSQVELCDLCDMDAAHMSKIMSGKRKCISVTTAFKIAKALGEPVEKVFETE